MLVQYFTEARYTLGADMQGINNVRSVLQVAPVTEGSDGWLRANRSAQVPLPLLPPDGTTVDRGPIRRPTQPAVWHVKAQDAMIIAAAELNRWTPRWCPDEDHSYELLQGYSLHASPYCLMHTTDANACIGACKADVGCVAVVVKTGSACPRPPPPGPPALHGLQLNMQAGASFFRSLKTNTALECELACNATKMCGSLVFRHRGSSPGAGGGVCDGVADSCCYLLANPNPPMHPHRGWDSWASGGDPSPMSNCSSASVKPSPTTAYCSLISESAFSAGPASSDVKVMQPNTSSWSKLGILTSTVQPWRDETRVAQYFEPPTHRGADPHGWEWELRTAASLVHRVTKQRLDFRFRISANGTILSVSNGTAPLSPLRQFRRDSWSPLPPLKSDDRSWFGRFISRRQRV